MTDPDHDSLLPDLATLRVTLAYIVDMTYCGNDGEWHFKPGYDPQIAHDTVANIAVATQLAGKEPLPPSEAAFARAENLVNHQCGVSVRHLAVALAEFRASGIREALEILHDEGWLGESEQRIRALLPENQ